MAAILDFPLPVWWKIILKLRYSTKGMSLAGNVGVAVKHVFPPSVELKIYHILYFVHTVVLIQ